MLNFVAKITHKISADIKFVSNFLLLLKITKILKMSNFTSLENITTEIQSLILKMNSGKLQLEELESLHSLTRDLNERLLILKYKAYEEKVFGAANKNEAVDPTISNKEIQDVITEMSDFLTNDSSSSLSEIEDETMEDESEVIVESEVTISAEEPAFGFDLFETDSAMSFAPEVKPDMETFSESRPFFSNEPEEQPEEQPVVTADVSTSYESAAPNAAVDIFKSFQGLDSGSRLMSPKIQSLVGAFGLNEKLQCIRELFNGSSDAFNQAIEKVDNQTNFENAKLVLSEYAMANSWDLDSNLVNEFLQKVERRFL